MTSSMKPQSSMLLSHRRSSLYRHCRVQALLPRRFYHHSNRCKNDNPRSEDAGATAAPSDATDDYHHQISSTIPKMGRGVKVGQYATTTRTYSSEQVENFGRLIRDFNPLHSSSPSISSRDWWGTDGSDDDDDQIQKLFELQQSTLKAAGIDQGKALVHGIFVSGIFSCIFAGIAPGCVYVNQSLEFRAPVFVDETVVGCIHIEKIRDWTRRKGGVVAECQTRVYKLALDTNNKNNKTSCSSPSEAELVVQGRANVWLPIGNIQTNDED